MNNIDPLLLMQRAAGKPCEFLFMHMFFDTYHPPKAHCQIKKEKKTSNNHLLILNKISAA